MHYVIGDIHGQIDMLKRLLKKLNLQPEDEVYFVGDWFDRFYTRRDELEMCEWMQENLSGDSIFKSVVGNHDIGRLEHIQNYAQIVNSVEANPMFELLKAFDPDRQIEDSIRGLYPALERLICDMPLYYEFEVNGTVHLVTHSWLVDENRIPLGHKEFDKGNLSRQYSVWDRKWSLVDRSYEDDMPLVIHGHTPTLGEVDKFVEGVTSLAKIKHVSSKNINIDCCAFYSPMRGGNLAAYRCEDGKEFYAFEEEDFYSLVDYYMDAYQGIHNRISKEEYLFAVLFYNHYADTLCREDTHLLDFKHPEAERAFWHMKKIYTGSSPMETSIDINRKMRFVKSRIQETVPNFWIKCRGMFEE